MTNKYKFTSAERRTMREQALKEYGLKRGRIEIGSRINLEDETIEPHQNIRCVSKMEDWEDTDLFDKSDWAFIYTAIELDEHNEGCLDLWVYSLGNWGELEGQVQAYFSKERGLYRIGSNGPIIWDHVNAHTAYWGDRTK